MGIKKKWIFSLFFSAFISILLFISSISSFYKPYQSSMKHNLKTPPSFAYYITGAKGDVGRVFRLLLAVYHPRNRYLLHIGAEGGEEERSELVARVKSVPAMRFFANVDVFGKPEWGTYMGSSNLAAALRAAAVLLRMDGEWSWFVLLSASDYPLVTQDDMSHVFSTIEKDLNFIDHSSDLGWKEGQRVQPIVVDPGIYLARKGQIFHATQKRPTPESFKFFTGSPWVILSRSFLEFCILGWDNLPRTLLMYFTNVILSEEGYYHTVICNSPEFKNTTVNSDLRYMIWDNPPKMEPLYLSTLDYDQMAQSGAAFARQFQKDEAVLNMIDEKILKRGRNRVTPGAWCARKMNWLIDPCSQWGDIDLLKPGLQAKKFEETVTNLLDDVSSQRNQCK